MNLRLAIAILALITGCTDVSNEPQEIKIDTPDGQIISHQTTVEPTPQTITVVAGDELSWLQSLGDEGPKFVSHYFPAVTKPNLKDYDAAFRAWQLDKSPPYTEQQVIQIIGGFLGNKCITDFNMEWVSVTDEYGTDYAVRSKTVEVMSFPFSSVLKRIEDRRYDFVHGLYYTVKETLIGADTRVRQPPQ